MNTDKTIVFLTTWALVSTTVLLLSLLPGSQIVFGNDTVSGYMSAVVWSFLFTVVGVFAPNLIKRAELKIKDERYSMIATVIILSPIIWLIKRFAVFTGLGVSNNLFVLLLAAVVAAVVFYGFKYASYYLNKVQ